MEQVIQFNADLKRQGNDYIKELLPYVRDYMIGAIKYSHQGKVTKEEFWNNLFITEGTNRGKNNKPLIELKDYDQSKRPEDPYGSLDFQATLKYLAFGGDRILGEDKGRKVYARDSYLFFKKFKCPYIEKKGEPCSYGGPAKNKEFTDILHTCMKVRNFGAHDTQNKVIEITPQTLGEMVGWLKTLTKPLRERGVAGWEKNVRTADGSCLMPINQFWAEQEKEYEKRFGTPPIDQEELGLELFCSEEENLTKEQSNALEEGLEYYNIYRKNGLIYREKDRKSLMEKLKGAPSVLKLLPAPLAAPVKPPEPQLNLQRILPVRPPIKAQAAALLKKFRGGIVDLREDVVEALTESFTLLVDESIFMGKDERKNLEENLLPVLKKNHRKLYVDESVISTLFRDFRRSVPYTELELNDMDEDIREDMQSSRRKYHSKCKEAIKAVRSLRLRRCLEVVSSLTDSEDSFENIFRVAQTNPQARFLVLTMKRNLVEDLGSVSGKNVVAAKPSFIGDQMVIYGPTLPVFGALLEEQGQTSVVRELLRVGQLPGEGKRVIARWPDGTEKVLRLGAELGKGGEGSVYFTKESDSVVKIYAEDRLTSDRRDKLKEMVGNDPDIPGMCWPQAMVYNLDEEWVGYLMPKGRGQRLAETAIRPGRDNENLTKLGWTRKSLATIAANIASAFRQMHEKGILMGDISPFNILVDRDCSVSFVDCDSYQYGDHPCPVASMLYVPPEVHREMKAMGGGEFGFTRTLEHENYSLAVLLFETLMFGKAPYESRNTDNDDVIQAIIAGNFPYPYSGSEENENARVMAPVGMWRQIWSHMTFKVKTGFYNTFTGKQRLSAADWEDVLREYVRQIELGHSSDELVPSGYKDTSDRGDEKLVELVCSECGSPFNLGQEVYQRRKERGEPDLCATHWDLKMIMQRRKVLVYCSDCGGEFKMAFPKWEELNKAGKPLLCPECWFPVICEDCHEKFFIRRDTMEKLRREQRPLHCPRCRWKKPVETE